MMAAAATPRDFARAHAALRSAFEAVASLASVPVDDMIQAARENDFAGCARFDDAELLELLERVLARAPLPAGEVGEAALRFLLALRQGRCSPVQAAMEPISPALRVAVAPALADWVRGESERAEKAAAALQEYATARRAQGVI